MDLLFYCHLGKKLPIVGILEKLLRNLRFANGPSLGIPLLCAKPYSRFLECPMVPQVSAFGKVLTLDTKVDNF